MRHRLKGRQTLATECAENARVAGKAESLQGRDFDIAPSTYWVGLHPGAGAVRAQPLGARKSFVQRA